MNHAAVIFYNLVSKFLLVWKLCISHVFIFGLVSSLVFVVCMSISTDHRTLLYTFAECHNETAQLHNRFVRGSFLQGPTLMKFLTLYSEIKAKLGIQPGHSVGNASLCHILSW